MFGRVSRLEKTGIPLFIKDKVFGLKKIEEYLRLVEYDENFIPIWISPEEKVVNFIATRGKVIYTIYKEKTISREIYNLKLNYIFEYPILILDTNCDEEFFYGNNKALGLIKFDFINGKVCSIFRKERIEGLIKVIKKYIIQYGSGKLQTYNKYDFSLMWNQDLSELTKYKNGKEIILGVIQNLYLFRNSLIVASGDSVLSLDIESGTIQWQTRYDDFQPNTLHVIGEIVYLSKGTYFSSVDLNTGKKILETLLVRPFDIDKPFQNYKYALVGSDVTYFDNYFYFSDKHEGQYYLAKMDPHTGNVIDYQILDGISSNMYPPTFHNDMMFLLDSNGTLHIYVKI